MEHFQVGNQLVERVFARDVAAGTVVTSSLRLRSSGTRWCSLIKPSVEYVLALRDPISGVVEQLSSKERHREVTHELTTNEESCHLKLTMVREDIPLEVELHYECYEGFPFIRQWVAVTYHGHDPLFLEEVSLISLQMNIPPADVKGLYGLDRIQQERRPLWFRPNQFDLGRERRLLFDTGRWHSASWLALWRKSNPEGLIFGWETCAPGRCRVGDQLGQRGPGVLVSIRPGHDCQSGVRFESPKAFIGLYEGDLDDGCHLAQRFVEARLSWPMPDEQFPYVFFSSHLIESGFNAQSTRAAIEQCAKLGLEGVVIDSRWAGPDLQPCPETFPEGLAPLSELCHQHGMKFGIHLSLADVIVQCGLVNEHPEWISFEEGRQATRDLAQAASLGLPEARQWLIERIVEVLTREKIDWLLLDTQPWGVINTLRYRIAADQDFLAAIGFEKMLEELHGWNSTVLLKQFEAGLSHVDFRLPQQYVSGMACNEQCSALQIRQSLFDLSYILPPRFLGKAQVDIESRYANRSCLFGGPWMLTVPPTDLKPGSPRWTRLAEDIALFKRLRELFRSGQVLHLLAPGELRSKTWDGWDAIGSYSADDDQAVVLVYHTRGEHAKRPIPMKGLAPQNTYVVKYHDSGHIYKALGRDILRHGLPVELDSYEFAPGGACTEVIMIQGLPPVPALPEGQ